MTALECVLVVGGGVAGVAAAETLRREGYRGSLAVLGDEPSLPYDRPPLSKQVLTGAWELDRTRLRAQKQYRELDIHVLHARAEGLDVRRRLVHLADGHSLVFDGLVIATGVRPRRLPGQPRLSGVHVLRTSTDVLGLRAAFRAGGRVVIVGAGLIGLEVAASARGLGLDVTVIDPLPRPMIRQVGPEIAEVIAALHREQGVDLRMGVGVEEILGEDGQVTGVALADGEVVPADCVLVAIGAEPAVDWLRDSGLPLGDGVECDEYCRAAPGVYAAGDVASWVNSRYGRRMRVEHRMNATEQGNVAAFNLLHGDVKPFTPLPYFWSDQYKVKIQAHGVLAEDADVTIAEGTVGEPRFVAEYRVNDQLTGVLGWNAPTRIRPYRQALLEQPFAVAGVV
jgi:3-phenylpropionate/trans-cinnamate dioxygenase ferredoxin reductase subunit